MKLRTVLVFLVGVSCSGVIQHAAQASSLLHDIEKSIKRIDRQLCSNAKFAKCKISKAKSVRSPPSKPNRAAPADVPPPVLPTTAPKSVAVPHLAPPLPKFRPVDLNSDIKPPVTAPVIVKKPQAAAPVVAINPPAAAPVIVIKPPVAAPVIVKKPQAAAPVIVNMPPPVEQVIVNKPSPPVSPSPPQTSPPVAPETVSPPSAEQAGACLKALAATGTSFAPVPQPETSPACQVDTPVRLNSFVTKAGVVKLPDQPTFKCAFALKLSQFVDQQMQPLVQKSMGSAVVAMGTGPGFNCRGRNGDFSAKMSEHAIGDAVDIEYMKLANASRIQVKDALTVESPSFAFLRDMRASACNEFTTVLGPGANAAHVEHFHLDLEVRRGSYRICE